MCVRIMLSSDLSMDDFVQGADPDKCNRSLGRVKDIADQTDEFIYFSRPGELREIPNVVVTVPYCESSRRDILILSSLGVC
jgi:hypothetical protein